MTATVSITAAASTLNRDPPLNGEDWDEDGDGEMDMARGIAGMGGKTITITIAITIAIAIARRVDWRCQKAGPGINTWLAMAAILIS